MGVEDLGEYAERLIKHKAKRLIGRAGFVRSDQADIEQELRLDLLRRLPKFDPSKASLGTFDDRVVRHKIASLVASRKAPCRDHRRCRCSLNDPLEDKGGAGPAERGDMVDEDAGHLRTGGNSRPPEELVDLRRDIRTVLAGLPPGLRRLCRRLMKETPTEVERETGTARGTLYEAIQKIRRRFEKARLREYL
jgi:RNA polymerase sigma-70 factor (ECF subfamily)